APQYQRRLRFIGPPPSASYTPMRWRGLPDKPLPFGPELKSDSHTLFPRNFSFSKVNVPLPLNTLLPGFVSRLMNTPADCTSPAACTETSPPPVTTWISWNASKL